jgi:leucyl-tRNA synthetase
MALILRQRSVQKLAWLRSSIEQYTCHDLSRTVFSLTGKWPKQIEETTLHDIETHWKPKVPDLVKDAQAQVDSDQKLTYVLSMFPYPSGQLHMGHVRVYAISDAMAHYNRMMKRKVIHPMGWDAFGLPAENAAIERNIKPEVWTRQNIQSMKTQLQELACLFDWDRELATCDPDYYKWTQYLFIQMFKAGLAYQQEAVVNWDPVDQTVLADEQVDQDGRSWRSGAIVEKRPLKQWFLRTTQFSKDLYDGLDDPSLDNWRDIVKIQRNWIGNCNGTNIEFKLESGTQPLSVWTDRPELIHGVSFIGLSPGHLLDRSADILTSNIIADCLLIPNT